MPEQDRYRFDPCGSQQERLRYLEDKVADLRMSRRILMTLLEQAQAGRDQELERLQRENGRLRRELALAARRQWRQNGCWLQKEEAQHGKNSMETP